MSALRSPLNLVLCLALLLAASNRPSEAAAITGSLDVAGVDVAIDGADLATSTLITGTDMVTTASAGDLSSVPVGEGFGPLLIDTTDPLGSFTFTNATYGTFATSSAAIGTQTADLLTLVFIGLFTPGPGLPGTLDATLVRLDVIVERLLGENGAQLDMRLTMTPQEAAVPEPAVLGLLAMGGLALATRRRTARH
jgi:hypothetical protein